MRILLLTPIFQPEPNHLKGLAYARQVARQGHSIQVLTGFPNYPGGKVYKGYKVKWHMREVIDGIEVVRVAHYPSHDRSSIRRFINYFSFALVASSIGLFSVKRPDVIHVYQGATTLMIPAILFKILYRVPIVLDIQDLWPESVISSGMFNVPGSLWMLHMWCRFTYAVSKKIVVLSSGYKALLEKRGVHRDKIEVVYNWCDERSIEILPRNESVGVKFGLHDKFNVVFAGTMGKVQALDAVIDAADLIKTELPGVQLVFVGGGVDLPKLMDSASSRKLTNVVFIPRQPASEISKILAFADVLLIHLRGDLLGRIGIPQKTQAYLAAGKPILMAVDGESTEIIKAANAGIACKPEDSEAIASAIRRLFTMPARKREAMGRNGQRYYHEHFSFMRGVTEMINVYRICVAGKTMEARPCNSLHRSLTLKNSDCIRDVRITDIANVVDVHLTSFQNFFLTFLGRQFLKQLYREIAWETGRVFLVAMSSDNEVIGFVAGVPDLIKLYRRLAREKWLTFGLSSIRAAIFRPSIIPRLWRALNSSTIVSAASCSATLMSIAVAPEAKGKGVGKCLVEQFSRAMAQQGIRRFCLTTDRDHNEATNSFYRKLGFTKTREFQTPEGRWMYEYVITTQL